MRSTMTSADTRPAAIWSWPGWPNTTPVIVVRLPSIKRMARKAKQPPAASSEPVLTPTNPLCPSNVLVLCTVPATGSVALGVAMMLAAHGPIDHAHLVGGSRHGCVVVAARVGVAGVGHAQRPCGGIHPGNKPVALGVLRFGLKCCASALPYERGQNAMSLGFYFTPSSFTAADYDEAVSQLEAAGAGVPAGRLYHVALETDGQIQVFDVWDSQESFEAFGETLVPIMTALGADPGQPMVSKVHNIIQG